MRRCVGLFAFTLVTGSSLAASAQRSDTKSPDTFTFLVMAGIHQSGSGPSQALRDLVAAARTTRPAFIVANGDVSQDGAAAEFRQFQDSTSSLTNDHIGVYATPGVRDVGPAAEGKEAFTRAFGRTYQSFDYSGTHFLLLDSTIALHRFGHFDKAEQDWLTKDLKKVRADTPIFAFFQHSLEYKAPSERLVDNDFEFLPILSGHNVVALFQGGQSRTEVETINGISAVTSSDQSPGAYYRCTVTQTVMRVERIEPGNGGKATLVTTAPIIRRPRSSVLRAGWDDPDVPFLERRRPAVTLEPRAIVDNPDQETADYRVDDGPWKPLRKDARDIWKAEFATKAIPVGMHSADVRLNTSANGAYRHELIFEVERGADEPTRRWAIDLDGPIQSNPLLLGGDLIVSSLDGHVYALELPKGKHRWAFPTKGQFLASPVSAQDALYIGSTDHTFYCLDSATGKLRWHHDFDAPILGTAAVASGTVCVAAGTSASGIDVASGTVKWTQPLTGTVSQTIATDGAHFYLSDSSHTVVALDAINGRPAWSRHFTRPTLSGPAVAGNVVVVSDGALRGLSVRDGQDAWTRAGGPGMSFGTPGVAGNVIYAAAMADQPGAGGALVALEAAGGSVRWNQPLPQPVYGAPPRVAQDGASLAIMGGRGHVSIHDTATGKEKWSYELGPGLIFSAPEYDGKSVYTVTMDDGVQAIDGPHMGAH